PDNEQAVGEAMQPASGARLLDAARYGRTVEVRWRSFTDSRRLVRLDNDQRPGGGSGRKFEVRQSADWRRDQRLRVTPGTAALASSGNRQVTLQRIGVGHPGHD